ncbi:MAG: peptide-methionine (R)-S-oxide reductase MsrB [Bacteroidetes bacterium]|nr:peptide-methionine (R)-S-oxide reductase MsrB [Bacteroidota bacterium]
MKLIKIFSITILSLIVLYGCSVKSSVKVSNNTASKNISDSTEYKGEKLRKSNEEWKAQMTPDQYEVMREKGTERAYTGKYWDNHEKGIYKCSACGLELFTSDTKFDSGTGWPSFWQPINETNVLWIKDNTHGMERDEVVCARCGSHLGHVFDDGPAPTGLRYCMNSICLDFVKEK